VQSAGPPLFSRSQVDMIKESIIIAHGTPR
jgi:hypothetical protein